MKTAQKNYDPSTISREEGYELVKAYATYFFRNKFTTLKDYYSVEDVVNEIYVKFLERKFFEKYNPSFTSKKYFVMTAVRNSISNMINHDIKRVTLNAVSTDTELAPDLYLEDIIEDKHDYNEDVDWNVDYEYHEKQRERILKALPDFADTKIHGYSPLLKKDVVLSYRVLALHLESGYKPKDLCSIFLNPKNGKPISIGSMYRHITNLREFLLDNVVLYQN